MTIKAAIFLGALLTFGSALQAASVYNYAFGGLGGDLGSSTHTFAPSGGSGPTITANGFKPGSGSTVTTVHLYSKGSGVFPPPNDESGLGLTNDPTGDGEITSGSFIELDLGNLSISSLGIYTESTTGDEQWEIWGSNTAASAGHAFSIPATNAAGVITGSSEGDQNVSILAGDRYIFITATDGNVLLGGLTATAPEPGTASLLGLALLGSGLLFRRGFGKKNRQS